MDVKQTFYHKCIDNVTCDVKPRPKHNARAYRWADIKCSLVGLLVGRAVSWLQCMVVRVWLFQNNYNYMIHLIPNPT